jgi:hypothetical protein
MARRIRSDGRVNSRLAALITAFASFSSQRAVKVRSYCPVACYSIAFFLECLVNRERLDQWRERVHGLAHPTACWPPARSIRFSIEGAFGVPKPLMNEVSFVSAGDS